MQFQWFSAVLAICLQCAAHTASQTGAKPQNTRVCRPFCETGALFGGRAFSIAPKTNAGFATPRIATKTFQEQIKQQRFQNPNLLQPNIHHILGFKSKTNLHCSCFLVFYLFVFVWCPSDNDRFMMCLGIFRGFTRQFYSHACFKMNASRVPNSTRPSSRSNKQTNKQTYKQTNKHVYLC